MRTLFKLMWLIPALAVAPLAIAQEATGEAAAPTVTIDQGPRVQGEVFEYSTGGKTYQGYLARNVADPEPRPAVLIVHEWWGLNDYVKHRADQLAALGFVALAVDMYGNGQATSHPDEAGEFSSRVMQDWPTARASLEAAMAKLRENPAVDGDHIAAIGYCFGGGVVMNMALAGMPIEAAISFHGSPTQAVDKPQPFDGIVQLHNGADDPLVKRDALKAMAAKLKSQGATIKVINYPQAKHAFSNPDATEIGEENGLPLAYNAAADAASWQAALLALDKALNGN
ncbi:dienelactone hydrolase family protein [Halomonas sp. HP20-15]|uniref:dienelactone hydrolase family protein n=1 Tax=Halomonas sp. HP20-15 TaxID=3085901 RepID=UPI002980FFBB|nr:dienelactone hydrolase family protein [Halomonas sp. HP20-15]MDW5378299.1 dienelactone hydrolase family protein [Halomonas sp. HP20-15]